ncbi:MAG: prepilin peptidase [Candidatus Asgardarchaeia archaeon]
MEDALYISLGILLIPTVIQDVMSRKIMNEYILPTILIYVPLGILYSYYKYSPLYAICLILFSIVSSYTYTRLLRMGGGDFKLMMITQFMYSIRFDVRSFLEAVSVYYLSLSSLLLLSITIGRRFKVGSALSIPILLNHLLLYSFKIV